jgi:hypothetical protein
MMNSLATTHHRLYIQQLGQELLLNLEKLVGQYLDRTQYLVTNDFHQYLGNLHGKGGIEPIEGRASAGVQVIAGVTPAVEDYRNIQLIPAGVLDVGFGFLGMGHTTAPYGVSRDMCCGKGI